jgi:hypothetical protein
MRPLRPVTILAAGLPLAGAAVSIVAAIVGHDAWTARGGFIWFVMGAVLGALILTPIALAEAFRAGWSHLIGPYAFRLEWYVSLSMAVATGYLLATMRQGAFDLVSGLAIAIVLVGAMIKMAMEILFGHEGRKAA